MADASDIIARDIVAGLRSIGYTGNLVEENYGFLDYFSPQREERRAVAVAFGQTPPSYESSLIAVARANGAKREFLVDEFRALAAIYLLEIDGAEVREWVVSGSRGAHQLRATYSPNQVERIFIDRAYEWKPRELLRAKNVNDFAWSQQLSLFAGLIPELEEQIQLQLDPLLKDTLSKTKRAYRLSTGSDPNDKALFKLVFNLLTAKVFIDRGLDGFRRLPRDADSLLAAVARHYREQPVRLLNQQAREVAAELILNSLDFRNLSVEILAQIWESTLLDKKLIKELGIHRTPRSVVRYLVKNTPFEKSGDAHRIIFEPCSGNAAFLVGAMQKLRSDLFSTSPIQRQSYLKQHLAAMERDSFGVEISRLSLTLADFPNPNGWDIRHEDVFRDGSMREYLARSGVILCNPPFEKFKPEERERYSLRAMRKPAELLHRILDDLQPSGVLGFVLPRVFMDGQEYSSVRKRIAQRFASIELTSLPDHAFKADAETVLLIASDPIPHDVCRIVTQRVADDVNEWRNFDRMHKVTWSHTTTCGVADCASGFPYPQLPSVWQFLTNHNKLAQFADVRRGIEWKLPLTIKGKETGNRSILVRDKQIDGYEPGVAPRTEFASFESPAVRYLSMLAKHQRGNAWKLPWKKPKAILYKSGRSRGPWKMSASPDLTGLVCYQTYVGVWPTSEYYDPVLLAAILNGPVANAFIAVREGKTDVTVENIRKIPMPVFTKEQRDVIRGLVQRYQAQIDERDSVHVGRTLMEIDAFVLDGYRMPPQLEREVLEFFRGHEHERRTLHPFGTYIPEGCQFNMSLSRLLANNFSGLSSEELLKRAGLR